MRERGLFQRVFRLGARFHRVFFHRSETSFEGFDQFIALLLLLFELLNPLGGLLERVRVRMCGGCCGCCGDGRGCNGINEDGERSKSAVSPSTPFRSLGLAVEAKVQPLSVVSSLVGKQFARSVEPLKRPSTSTEHATECPSAVRGTAGVSARAPACPHFPVLNGAPMA